MNPLLDVRDVSVSLGARPVLRRLSFGPLAEGTVTALIGSMPPASPPCCAGSLVNSTARAS